MEIVHQIISGLLVYVPRDPAVIFTLLGTGTAVAALLQIIKHLGKLQEAKKTVMFLLGGLSTLATMADQVLQLGGANAVAGDLGWVIASAVFMHRFAVSPAYHAAVIWLTKLSEMLADVKAYRVQNAAQPKSALSSGDIPGAEPHTFSLGL